MNSSVVENGSHLLLHCVVCLLICLSHIIRDQLLRRANNKSKSKEEKLRVRVCLTFLNVLFLFCLFFVYISTRSVTSRRSIAHMLAYI